MSSSEDDILLHLHPGEPWHLGNDDFDRSAADDLAAHGAAWLVRWSWSVTDRDSKALTGELLRDLTLDTARNYQSQKPQTPRT